MRVKYSTRASYNPVPQSTIPRYAVPLAAITEPAAEPIGAGHCSLNSLFSLDTGHHLPGSHPACHIVAVQDAVSSNHLRRKPRKLSNPSTPHRATA